MKRDGKPRRGVLLIVGLVKNRRVPLIYMGFSPFARPNYFSRRPPMAVGEGRGATFFFEHLRAPPGTMRTPDE